MLDLVPSLALGADNFVPRLGVLSNVFCAKFVSGCHFGVLAFKLAQQRGHRLFAFLWRIGEIHLRPTAEILTQNWIYQRIQLGVRKLSGAVCSLGVCVLVRRLWHFGFSERIYRAIAHRGEKLVKSYAVKKRAKIATAVRDPLRFYR